MWWYIIGWGKNIENTSFAYSGAARARVRKHMRSKKSIGILSDSKTQGKETYAVKEIHPGMFWWSDNQQPVAVGLVMYESNSCNMHWASGQLDTWGRLTVGICWHLHKAGSSQTPAALRMFNPWF